MEMPFSAAADRNKEAIGDALAQALGRATSVLEIGSGTGQHAVYLCGRFDHLQWQLTEQAQHLEGLRALVSEAGLANLHPPLLLDVSSDTVENKPAYSFAYSANTAHIMGIDQVAAMMSLVSDNLDPAGVFALYGPFKENGQHNSDGNTNFDRALRAEDPQMGIRDIAELEAMAQACGLSLQSQIAMPSNNRILLWSKA